MMDESGYIIKLKKEILTCCWFGFFQLATQIIFSSRSGGVENSFFIHGWQEPNECLRIKWLPKKNLLKYKWLPDERQGKRKWWQKLEHIFVFGYEILWRFKCES